MNFYNFKYMRQYSHIVKGEILCILKMIVNYLKQLEIIFNIFANNLTQHNIN